MTVFGEVKPSEQEILRPYLYEDGKRVAYITGASLYNQLNLILKYRQCIRLPVPKSVFT